MTPILYRDNNFNKDQIKGLNLVINATKKKNPYIKGWEFSEDFEKYSTTLYINIFIDILELSEILDLDVRDYYLKLYQESPSKIYSGALSVFFKEKGQEENYRNNEELFDRLYDVRKELSDYINYLYNLLPDEIKIYYIHDGNFGKYETLVTINIETFKQNE